MNEIELKQQYANYLHYAFNLTVKDYENKGYTLDHENSTPEKLRYSKVDMKNSKASKAKVARVLIEKNPEFTFEYFQSFVTGKHDETLPAFNVFTATHNLSLSELSDSERSVIGLPSVKRIQERANFKELV